jgi:hypothetical protein
VSGLLLTYNIAAVRSKLTPAITHGWVAQLVERDKSTLLIMLLLFFEPQLDFTTQS